MTVAHYIVNIAFDNEQITINVKYVFLASLGCYLLTKKSIVCNSIEVSFLGPKKGKMVPKRQSFIYRESLLV